MGTKQTSRIDLFQFLTALLLAAIAFWLMWQWGGRIKFQGEAVMAVVAKKDLEAPVVLTKDDVVLVSLPRAVLPQTALVGNEGHVEGLTLIHPLSAGQVLTSNELLSKADPDLLGVKIPKTKFGFSLSHSWFAGSIPAVQKGDFISILASGGTKENTGIVAVNIPVIAVTLDKEGVSDILVSVSEDQSQNILQARAADASLQLIVVGIGGADIALP